MESPWGEDVQKSTHYDAEWLKMSSDFTNVGYREGITAGKESSLQEGFDAGFSNVGVPMGHTLGLLRGQVSAVIAFLNTLSPDTDGHGQTLLKGAQGISSQLSQIRFSDVMPPDLEAEKHARLHLEAESDAHESIAIVAKQEREGAEDIPAKLNSGDVNESEGDSRPSMKDVYILEVRLSELMRQLGVGYLG